LLQGFFAKNRKKTISVFCVIRNAGAIKMLCNNPGSNLLVCIHYFCINTKPNNMPMSAIVHRLTMKEATIIILATVLFLLNQTTVQAQKKASRSKGNNQTDDYFDPAFVRNENQIFDQDITTVLFHREGWELSPPIIELNSDERLTLSFDDLAAGYKVFGYTVIHCDADWQPTDLWQNEYISGFTDDYIRDYNFSFNTLQAFTNYHVTIPNDHLNFTISGNYLLKVYPDGQPDKPVLTRRFMVVESKVSIKGQAKAATPVDMRYSGQEVQFSVFTGGYQISEPMRDLKAVVLQNGRWDNALKDLKPMMLRGSELDYRYTDGTNTFEAGNEFRYFDIKSLRYNGQGVFSIENRNDGYHVALLPDKARAVAPYITYADINGQRLIKTEDASNSITESEYVYVDFFIGYPEPMPDGGVYILGALTDWQFTAPANALAPAAGYSRMEYNYARQGYQARLYLKQGYYNYLYAFMPDNTPIAQLSPLEGSRFETKNNYTVLIYYREPGSRYDRLIAAESIDN